MKKIELLAPAKNRDAAFAAIDYGADAIYIGGTGFGARYAASNSISDIAAVVEYAHAYGVRVHCTLNTLLFESELAAAEATAREVVAAGVDALIVQDLAFARMGLGVELHASTQMSNMTVEGVRFLEECGFSRVVLERALSLHQIAQIASATSVELEAFVHGAICVGHSGRCYLSRSLSQRSGNRGECSQPCRLSYDLCDESGRKLLENKHLLSVRDLNLSSHIGSLLDAGVVSFKIEGRLKDIGYTKNIVAHYRAAIDEQLALRPSLCRSSVGVSTPDFAPNPSKSFARGESEYLFLGQQRNLASFDTPKSMGERIGQIVEQRADRFKLERGAAPLNAGDGVCFVTSAGLTGTNINVAEGEWFIPNRAEGLGVGAELYRNFDKRFVDRLERSRVRRTIGAVAQLQCSANKIIVTYTDAEGISSSAALEGEFEPPRNTSKMEEVARAQLSKSGDTIFEVERVDFEGEVLFVASSQLATLRRKALEELTTKRRESHQRPTPFVERREARVPLPEILPSHNVVNSVARAFYFDHGAESVADGYDLSAMFDGEKVLESSYCIRREIGECLKQGSTLRGNLYLQQGGVRYSLEFDCAACQMSLIKEK